MEAISIFNTRKLLTFNVNHKSDGAETFYSVHFQKISKCIFIIRNLGKTSPLYAIHHARNYVGLKIYLFFCVSTHQFLCTQRLKAYLILDLSCLWSRKWREMKGCLRVNLNLTDRFTQLLPWELDFSKAK